jgi:hypothetical protein
MQIITINLNYPAAVGEARNVEPHEAGLEPREKPANIAPYRFMPRVLSIRSDSF